MWTPILFAYNSQVSIYAAMIASTCSKMSFHQCEALAVASRVVCLGSSCRATCRCGCPCVRTGSRRRRRRARTTRRSTPTRCSPGLSASSSNSGRSRCSRRRRRSSTWCEHVTRGGVSVGRRQRGAASAWGGVSELVASQVWFLPKCYSGHADRHTQYLLLNEGWLRRRRHCYAFALMKGKDIFTQHCYLGHTERLDFARLCVFVEWKCYRFFVRWYFVLNNCFEFRNLH